MDARSGGAKEGDGGTETDRSEAGEDDLVLEQATFGRGGAWAEGPPALGSFSALLASAACLRAPPMCSNSEPWAE